MSNDLLVIDRYLEGFRRGDHDMVLDCLTDDVTWVLPGAFELSGKEAFDGEIENDAFTGRPIIEVTRTIEGDSVVIVEGTVTTQKKTGERLRLVFCDVFDMRDGKIARLVSYLMPLSEPSAPVSSSAPS